MALENRLPELTVEPPPLHRKWQCKQCPQTKDSVEEFAKHLRSHIMGHRLRRYRKPVKTKTSESLSKNEVSENSPFIKFDSLTTSQLEISQPNMVTNLMHINYQNREMCEQLVDPALVMPSKHTEECEPSQFNYTEILNLTNVPNGVTSEENQNSNHLFMENNLQILADAVTNTVDTGVQMSIKNMNEENLGTITPLNLFYLDDGHFASTVDNVEISEVNEKLQTNYQDNMVIVDNSIDKTVRLIDLNGQIINGSPFELNPLEENNTPLLEVLVCEICNKIFKTKAYLHRHLRKHTGEFSCNYCFVTFARKETLITHCCKEKSHAEKNQLTKIPETTPSIPSEKLSKDSNNTPDSDLLDSDTEPSRPDGKKKPTCSVCGLILSDASCLKRHLATHQKSLCYTCVYCGVVVTHRHSIRRHLKLNHPEYEHEWNNVEFVTSLQMELKKRAADDPEINQNAKKKKFTKRKGANDLNDKMPSHCPKKDSLLGTTIVDDSKLDFESNMVPDSKNSKNCREYFASEKSINSVKEDSLDLSSFTAHFDEDIGHLSFQTLALPDILCKGVAGEVLKFDSKENSPIKNFNIGSLLVFNASSKRTPESLPEVSFAEQLGSANISSKIDASIFCSPSLLSKSEICPEKIIRIEGLKPDEAEIFVSPVKTCGVMPSMPVLLCEEEKVESLEKVDEFKAGMGILVCEPPTVLQEESFPSCSAGYVLEDKGSMQLLDTSTDFTFYVLG